MASQQTRQGSASSACSTILGLNELNAVALDHFVYTPVSRNMISYLATAAYNVIQCDPTMMPPPPAITTAATTTATTITGNNTRLPPTPPKTPPPRAVPAEDAGLPTLEEFITQLVVSSNVQVPTLMSTLVYLNRLKSRLQPMAKGLRCTTHRIFLASLILAAKYLNDSSPKNKHWASYSVMGYASFGFSRTEVNLMEKQLLSLLDWDLRITEDDLYRELDVFLAPIREDVAARHERRIQRSRRVAAAAAATAAAQQAAAAAAAEEQEQQQQQRRRRLLVLREQQQQQQQEEEEAAAAAAWLAAQTAIAYATPPTTPGGSGRYRSTSSSSSSSPRRRADRQDSPDSLPGLSGSYTSRSVGSSRSYASSLSSAGGSSSSGGASGATTPLSSAGASCEAPYIYDGVLHTGGSSLYEPPVEIVLDDGVGHDSQSQQQQMSSRMVGQKKKMMVMMPPPPPLQQQQQQQITKQKSLLPYEISPEELRDLQDGGSRVKRMKGMLGRVFGSGAAVR
ncbi:PHO85 cyclin-1 [Cytospora paraplurivora]|uniref:PHO85 cyclin-1 n=1 Tax=Cytospora paraplurivora TaxID=2898453 RepID=A0AAN9UG99_9PEZI